MGPLPIGSLQRLKWAILGVRIVHFISANAKRKHRRAYNIRASTNPSQTHRAHHHRCVSLLTENAPAHQRRHRADAGPSGPAPMAHCETLSNAMARDNGQTNCADSHSKKQKKAGSGGGGGGVRFARLNIEADRGSLIFAITIARARSHASEVGTSCVCRVCVFAFGVAHLKHTRRPQ